MRVVKRVLCLMGLVVALWWMYHGSRHDGLILLLVTNVLMFTPD